MLSLRKISTTKGKRMSTDRADMPRSQQYCPQCQNPMKNLGNVSGIVMTSNPPQWTDTYICEPCKWRKDIRVSGQVYSQPDLTGYNSVHDAAPTALTPQEHHKPCGSPTCVACSFKHEPLPYPHSSLIYMDLSVRCGFCKQRACWRYEVESDEIVFTHKCPTDTRCLDCQKTASAHYCYFHGERNTYKPEPRPEPREPVMMVDPLAPDEPHELSPDCRQYGCKPAGELKERGE